jgi:hypothetical protein
VAASLVVLSGFARAADVDALPSFSENYIKVSGITPWVDGSSAAFQRRAHYSKDGAGGIEALSYTKELSKETNYQVDGRFLPGAADYLAQFKLTKNEVGSFEAGYKRFRTFYDGIGGFFPGSNAWLPIFERKRYVDRGKFWVTGIVNLPKQPVFTFKYSNELRNGTKDTTIWGDTDFTGIPIWSLSSLNPVTATRKLLPAYIQLGERQQTWELSARHSVGDTTATIAIIGTRIDNLDSRSVDRYFGELKPFPAIPANPPTLIPPALANVPNTGFDTQGFKENALTYLGKIEHKLNERVTVYSQLSYRRANGDISASRLISATMNTGAGPRTAIGLYTVGGRPPYSYTSAGDIKNEVITGIVGVRTSPLPSLHFDFALRGEDYRFTGDNAADYVSNQLVQATGIVTPVPVATKNHNVVREKPWTPAIDGRYTGIKTVALYASWDYRTLKQDERSDYGAFTVNTTNGVLTGPVNPSRDTIKEKHSNLKLGANWTPVAAFSFRPEFFTKDHENRFEGYGVSSGDFFILNYDIYGSRVSAIYRPLPTLTFNTRYIVQRGRVTNAGDRYSEINSGNSRRTQVAETIDWAPSKLFYVQTSVNRVYDTIITSYPKVTGLAQTVNHNADNNYWNGSIVAVFAIGKRTDASIQSTYYKADNYNPALATYTQPFGAGGKEYSYTVGVKRKFADKWVGSAKVGYFERTDETTGGNTNFRGPLAYFVIEHAL